MSPDKRRFLREGSWIGAKTSQVTTKPVSRCHHRDVQESNPNPLPNWTPELRDWLTAAASAAGFDAAGVAAVPEPHDPAATQEAKRFAAWIDAGRAGEMDYLKRQDAHGTFLRSGVQSAMPWARSVIVCALNYNADAPRSIDPAPPGAAWIGRYAWSGRTGADGNAVPTDYHNELLTRLCTIESALQQRAACTTRCYVDTGPILERNIAAQAGVGWIGRNTCVINQQLGSWLLLGVIVTSLPVEAASATLLAPDRCGSCTRCIDACPTGALLDSSAPGAPREMDASLCIAYLTIEKKGSIDEALRSQIGRPPIAAHEGMTPRPELINPALEWLAVMDSAEFKRRFKGSPLQRTGRKRLLRNVAIAMGNSGDAQFLPQLEAWAAQTADPLLSETAEWAKSQISLQRTDL